MIKPILQLAAIGVAGVALWKVASLFLLPLFFLLFKIALIAGLVMLAIWWINKNSRKDTPDAPPGDVSS
ncbi:MAG: hypothetical protein ACREME_11505 [Gemmatimonadales bacterium]